MNNV
jgi:hypothetical protein